MTAALFTAPIGIAITVILLTAAVCFLIAFVQQRWWESPATRQARERQLRQEPVSPHL